MQLGAHVLVFIQILERLAVPLHAVQVLFVREGLGKPLWGGRVGRVGEAGGRVRFGAAVLNTGLRWGAAAVGLRGAWWHSAPRT